LTNAPLPQVAHIFPYTILNKVRNPSPKKPTPEFWGLLGVFWNRDRIERWKKEIFRNPQNPETGVESCFNLICLTSTAHEMWNRGVFALKPLNLSDDKKKLDIQFFWQPAYKHQSGDRVNLLKIPKSSKGLSQGQVWEQLQDERKLKSYQMAVDRPPRIVQSGDTFTLTTDDPIHKPLPSWELLEMQWYLQRLAAMSGTPNLDLDDDDYISGSMLISGDNDTAIGSSFEHVI
jgi:HNH endonuclease